MVSTICWSRIALLLRPALKSCFVDGELRLDLALDRRDSDEHNELLLIRKLAAPLAVVLMMWTFCNFE